MVLPLLSISREELPASLPLATISHFGDMYKVAIHQSNHPVVCRPQDSASSSPTPVTSFKIPSTRLHLRNMHRVVTTYQRHIRRDRQPSTTACPAYCDKEIKIVYGEEKNYFVLGRLEHPRQTKNLLYPHNKPNEPTMEGPFHLYFLSPVSTVSSGHPSLVSLVITRFINQTIKPQDGPASSSHLRNQFQNSFQPDQLAPWRHAHAQLTGRWG